MEWDAVRDVVVGAWCSAALPGWGIFGLADAAGRQDWI
jgi:hypothetical protein